MLNYLSLHLTGCLRALPMLKLSHPVCSMAVTLLLLSPLSGISRQQSSNKIVLLCHYPPSKGQRHPVSPPDATLGQTQQKRPLLSAVMLHSHTTIGVYHTENTASNM
jgi:hypothetical protein